MSTCEPSGGDPTNLFQYDDEDPPEPDYFVADGHHIPPDPLLDSGTFIEVNSDPIGPNVAEPQSAQNGVSDCEAEQCRTPVVGVSNGTDRVTPSATAGAESTPSGRKGAPPVGAASESLPERPTWLPEGWRMDHKIRTSGASAGTVDRYYFEPVSGRKFRSKVEVDYFLQTGSKPNKKRKPDADANSQEKSGSKKKKAAPLNFDFNDVPEKVRWVLTDSVKDQWTPFVGEKIVPKSTRQDWNAAFHFSSS